jgi:hypothetical protein
MGDMMGRGIFQVRKPVRRNYERRSGVGGENSEPRLQVGDINA